MKNVRKGFTLVELLAVIVILAIIMIIAIPSVLGTMTTARKKSFCEYVTKVYMAAQSKYMSAQTLGLGELGCSFSGDDSGNTIYYFDITKDLGLDNVGDYKGYVGVQKPSGDETKPGFQIILYDSNYALVTKDDSGEFYLPFYIYTEEPDPDKYLIDSDDLYNKLIEAFENNINKDTKTINFTKLTNDMEKIWMEKSK